MSTNRYMHLLEQVDRFSSAIAKHAHHNCSCADNRICKDAENTLRLALERTQRQIAKEQSE